MRCSWWRKHKGMQRTLYGLALGQLISFDLAIVILTASLVSREVDAPLTLSFTTYLVLAVVYGGIMLYHRQKLLVPWYWYALLGFVDIHGNYLVNKAFQFTSITSVTILDSWTVAWAMLLTWMFLGSKYSMCQFLGAGICVAGLCLVLLSDAGVCGGGGSNPLLGDFLVIVGTLLFSMSNVGEEFCVKKKDRTEVLAMIGVFGMLFSGCEMAILERKPLESIKISGGLISAYAGYTVADFLFYTLVPFLLEVSGATLFNLSVLTAGMWVIAFQIFIYKQKVDWLYYVAFALVVFGICVYSEMGEDPDQDDDTSIEDGISLVENQIDCNPQPHKEEETNALL